MKRIILFLVCIVILISTGCQSSDRTVISISVPFSNDYLRKAIKLFEKRYDNVQIQLKEYEGDMTDNNSVEKYIASMSSEIMSGNGADIIYITGLPNKKYIEKGVLEDLYGYISSNSPGMDIFQENILNACIDNEKIFFLPINFSYPVLFVKNDIAADIDDTSWDWSGFLHVSNSITAKESGLHAIANLSGSELISYMLGGDYTCFVNYQTKESNFLSDEFVELTEFCNAAIQNEKIIYSGTDVEDAVKRGAIVFSYYNLYSFSDLASIMSNYGTDRSVLKLPMSISNKGNRFFSNELFAINSSSKNKDAAWLFLEFLISEEVQAMDELYGFPVNKMILDRKFNDALDMEYEGKDLSQARKEVEKVYSLIQELDTFSSYDFQINDIVNKELMSYFQGEKPLKEVLQNIDRKIYLYLNE